MDIPNTIEEAMVKLDELSPPEDIAYIKSNTEKKVLAGSHHTVGRWVRNNWGFNRKSGKLYDYFVKQGLWHPDDMSGVILSSFVRHVKNEPLCIEEEIKEYKRYWDEQVIKDIIE